MKQRQAALPCYRHDANAGEADVEHEAEHAAKAVQSAGGASVRSDGGDRGEGGFVHNLSAPYVVWLWSRLLAAGLSAGMETHCGGVEREEAGERRQQTDDERRKIARVGDATARALGGADWPLEEPVLPDAMRVSAVPPENEVSRKHFEQEVRIVAHVAASGWPQRAAGRPERSAVLEMGAGRGGLSYTLGRAMMPLFPAPPLPSGARLHFVPVDSAAVAHRRDANLEEETGHGVFRVLTDIRHLDPRMAPGLRGQGREVLVVGKHLCGGATDMALRCVSSSLGLPGSSSSSDEPGRPVAAGVVLATCCHHRCDWGTYVNRAAFRRLGMDALDFVAVCRLSSWCTDGGGGHVQQRQRASRGEAPAGRDDSGGGGPKLPRLRDVAVPSAKPSPTDPGDGQPRLRECLVDESDRRSIGRLCKAFLDAGRAQFLAEAGFSASRVVRYCSDEFTAETALLSAWRQAPP